MSPRDRFPAVVHVLLWRAARIYLLRRSATGFMDGYHALPGGHILLGESVTDAARRECLEETGVVADPRPRCVLPYISGVHQGFNFIFDARHFEGEPRVAEPELFDQGGWYAPDALPERVAPWLSEVLAMPAGHWYRELYWRT